MREAERREAAAIEYATAVENKRKQIRKDLIKLILITLLNLKKV